MIQNLADYKAHQRKHGFLKDDISAAVEVPKTAQNKVLGSRQPNKTESEFGRILEARKGRGEIHAYFYEGITLHWGDCMKYTPDFVVYLVADPVTYAGKPLLIEVKGGHIFDRDMVRFKGCRAEWKEYYDFEMHQKKAGEWKRIL